MSLKKINGLKYIQEIIRFKKDPLESMIHLQKSYGDLVYFGGPLKTLFLFSPTDIEYIFINEKNNNEKGDQGKQLQIALGKGLLVREKEQWRKRRKQISNIFHHQRYEEYRTKIKSITLDKIKSWKKGSEINLTTEISHLTFEISAELFVGGIPTDVIPELNKAILNIGRILTGKLSSPLKIPLWVPTPDHIKLKRSITFIDSIIYKIISARKKSGERGVSLLDSLIDHEDSLTDEEIRDEVVTFLVAGYETTAAFMTWTIYLFLKNNDALETFKNSPQGSKNRRNILKEVLRLYPSVPLISRQATAEIILKGHKIATGTNFVVSPFVIHRNPSLWDEPNLFKYQRFETEKNTTTKFIPFSMGPKRCIGEELAYIETEAVIETIIDHLNIALITKDINPVCKIALYMDKDLKVSVLKNTLL